MAGAKPQQDSRAVGDGAHESTCSIEEQARGVEKALAPLFLSH